MVQELYLLISNEQLLERVYRVEIAETTIGRSPSNTLCLSHPSVSRQHAVLLRTAAGFVIRDLGSRNGTQVNGQYCDEAEVARDTVLEIGAYSLKAYVDLMLAQQDAEILQQPTTGRFSGGNVPGSCRETMVRELTPAQQRVYNEFLLGRSEKEISSTLGISINTVHSHSRAIYTAFAVSSRAELLARLVNKPRR